MEVEVVRRREDDAFVWQDLRLAMAELARLLRLDPKQRMWPLENINWAVPIPGDPWLDCDLEDLARFALNNRPDLAENRFLVDAAIARLRLAKVRPWLPNFATTYFAGDFGGGPNQETFAGKTFMGKTGRIEKFRHRQDWDASIFWRLNNLGFGNVAEIREQRALYDQANFRALQTADRVVAQVVQAIEFVEYTAERVKILQAGLFDAQGRPNGPVYQNVERNLRRLALGQARPLETLDSVRSLNDIREAYANALTDYERARFRLLIALGMPARGIIDPRLLPAPKCCKSSGMAGRTPTKWAGSTDSATPPPPK
jgi:outer membrane protein TolC